MIGKKIKNPNPKSSKAERVKRLTDYIREPEKTNGHEKCIYSGSRGFICDELKLQQSEMTSLSMAATRSADPISHFVLSWREGEYPTPEQVEEAVTIFMNECGVDEHMAVYGLHSDTNNLHLHIAINRVNPMTEKVTHINGGFDIEAAHKAVARIVKAHGWEAEENALYFVDDSGQVVDTRNARDRKSREQQPSSRAQDYEQRTGEKSAERIGIETLPDVLKGSSNWDEFHAKMSEHGMRYEKKGSGAIIWVGEQAIKASSADRNASFSKLEKRFGEYKYVGPDIDRKMPEQNPQPLNEEFSYFGWGDYAKERREYFTSKKSARSELNKQIDTEYKTMLERQRKERNDVYSRNDWKRQGVLLNAMRSVVAAKHAGVKAELKEGHKEQRKEFSRKFYPFPDFEQWLREHELEQTADKWRYRRESKVFISSPDEPSNSSGLDIRNFTPKVDLKKGRVNYFRENMGKPSFTDSGNRVEITDWQDENVTFAALQLSAQKWSKGFYVKGNDEYKRMCVELAAEHGFKILNPELQTAIADEREQLRKERKERKENSPERNVSGFESSKIENIRHENIYEAHRADVLAVLNKQGGYKADESRIDGMIALRLRATGHLRGDIEKIISEHSPNVNSRVDYARRITDSAFTPRGDTQIGNYAKYIEQWRQLEDITLKPEPGENLQVDSPNEEQVRKNPESIDPFRESRGETTNDIDIDDDDEWGR